MKDSRLRPLLESSPFDFEYLSTQELKSDIESVPVANRASLLTLRVLTEEVFFSEGILDGFEPSQSELEDELGYLLLDGPFDDE